jgi:hypothetical protein
MRFYVILFFIAVWALTRQRAVGAGVGTLATIALLLLLVIALIIDSRIDYDHKAIAYYLSF